MKRIRHMDEAEILSLDDEEINNLIDMECAHKGAPLLPPHPGPAPDKEREVLITPDLTVYSVGSFEFTKVEDANKVLSVLVDTALINEDGYGDSATIQPINPGDYHYPKVETKKAFSQAKRLEGKEVLEAYKNSKSEWEEAKTIYDKASEARQSVVNVVREKIREVRARDNERASLRSEFNRYLALAEGDTSIAMNFLLKPKDPKIREEHSELIDELCPGYLVAEKLKGAV